MENIDIFNKYTAATLTKLYKSFPIPNTLLPDSLVTEMIGEDDCWEQDVTSNVVNGIEEGSDKSKKQRTDSYTQHSKIASATVSWLKDCGYIQTAQGGALDGQLYVLSPKGFEVLSAIPDSLQGEKESFGDKLINASNNVAGESGKALLTKTIGEIVGHAFKASIGA